MPKGKLSDSKANDSGLNFEAQLWAAAEQAVPAPDYGMTESNRARPEGLCLGLIFLKYISDAFEEKREQLLFGFSDPKSEWFIKDEPQRAEAAENRDEYLAANVFWLPPEARWHAIKAKAKSPEIGKAIDDAMGAIERENPTLKGVLPRDYARPSLDTATRASANRICEARWRDFCGAKDHARLGGLVDIISNIGFNESAAKSKDVLGRAYEYFLGKFASAEGTLQSANTSCSNRRMNHRRIRCVRGQMWPCASTSGGMFVSSEKFVEEHGGRVGDIAVYGQDKSVRGQRRFGLPKEARRVSARRRANQSNYTTWKLARMNLAIRGIDANLGPRNADSFRQDLHPDLKADFILANPPFNMSDWGGENLRQDMRWKFGMPPVNNANYAWIQHFIHHLSPVGVAGFVMANSATIAHSLSDENNGRRPQIRHQTKHPRGRGAEKGMEE